MKICYIFLLALCLITVMILTCEGRPPIGAKICLAKTIKAEKIKLDKKISEFQKLFPDNIINTSLLTGTLQKDFMANCTTRRHVLSFYTNEVLSVGKVHTEANKSGIHEDLLKIEDMLLFCQNLPKFQYFNLTKENKGSPYVLPNRCESNETEGIRKFRNKLNKITMQQRLNKAVSEMDTLLYWIDLFSHKISNKNKD